MKKRVLIQILTASLALSTAAASALPALAAEAETAAAGAVTAVAAEAEAAAETDSSESARVLVPYEFIAEEEVPQIYINTENGIAIDDESLIDPDQRKGIGGMLPAYNYINAEVSVSNCEGYELEAVPAQVKVRGNYTSTYPKKPIRIKFEKKQAMCGLNGGKKMKSWVLLAEYKDPSLLRNSAVWTLAKSLYSTTDAYCSDFRVVEVYLNGEYNGVYVLAEQQQVNDARVNLPEPKDTGDVKTGYFIEYDGYYTENPELEQFTIQYNDLTRENGSTYIFQDGAGSGENSRFGGFGGFGGGFGGFNGQGGFGGRGAQGGLDSSENPEAQGGLDSSENPGAQGGMPQGQTQGRNWENFASSSEENAAQDDKPAGAEVEGETATTPSEEDETPLFQEAPAQKGNEPGSFERPAQGENGPDSFERPAQGGNEPGSFERPSQEGNAPGSPEESAQAEEGLTFEEVPAFGGNGRNFQGTDFSWENPSAENSNDGEAFSFRGLSTNGFSIKSDVTDEAQRDFIQHCVQTIWDVLYDACYNDHSDLAAVPYHTMDADGNYVEAPSITSAQEAVASVVNVDSLIDMYILQEIAEDNDLAWSSFFFSLDMSEEGDHLLTYTAPWDFDSGFTYNRAGSGSDSLFAANSDNPWLVVFAGQDWFWDAVYARWQEASKADVFTQVSKMIETYTTLYAEEYAHNLERWHSDEPGSGTQMMFREPGSGTPQAEAAATLKEWIETRVQNLDRLFAEKAQEK